MQYGLHRPLFLVTPAIVAGGVYAVQAASPTIFCFDLGCTLFTCWSTCRCRRRLVAVVVVVVYRCRCLWFAFMVFAFFSGPILLHLVLSFLLSMSSFCRGRCCGLLALWLCAAAASADLSPSLVLRQLLSSSIVVVVSGCNA